MAKTGLSNQLLGKRIVPKPEYGSVSERDPIKITQNVHLWSGLQPDGAGDYHAYIDAAWVDSDGNVKIAVHDSFGATKEMWLTHVNLDQR